MCKEIMSTGRLCALLQRSTRDIEVGAAALGIAPEMIINGVAHWSTTQADDIARHFRAQLPWPTWLRHARPEVLERMANLPNKIC